MKKYLVTIILVGCFVLGFAQDWDGIPVPADPGPGNEWILQEDVSDDFNYTFEATSSAATFGPNDLWRNWYHNTWTGPPPTVWKRDNVSVEDGMLQIRANRQAGQTMNVNGQQLKVTNTGCVSSIRQIQYPVYIESRAKVIKSQLACATWMLSPDDTQEIDFLEAYGSDDWNNAWFGPKRVHVSHHVFIRQPFTDWQPHDEGSFYTDGTTVWREEFHRYGVFLRDPWHMEYYIDGKLVRTRSGKSQIDPVFHTNSVNPGNTSNDTRVGLSKPFDIIIDTEDQTWRAVQGLSPTDAELANEDDHTFKVDWIRVYKPGGSEAGPVTGVTLDQTEISTFIGDNFTLTASIQPFNAANQNITWSTDNSDVATVDQNGKVTAVEEGVANIVVTTEDGSKTATCKVTVTGEQIPASIAFDDAAFYQNTDFPTGSEITVSANFHAGTGKTVIESEHGGVKFWLREIKPGWAVANDYVASDSTVIGEESGVATATISLEGVPTTAEIPSENWYFLFVIFRNNDGDSFEEGIFPINIVESTSTVSLKDYKTFNIFPNPTQSIVNLRGDALQGEYQAELFSTSGQLLRSYESNGGDWQFNISDLPKGHYVVRLTSEDKVYRRSLIKQ